MASRQSKAQKETVQRVMHAFKHGELESGGDGRKVESPRQAIAIALSEAGASKNPDTETSRRRPAKTKAKARSGKTAAARKDGKRGQAHALGRGGAKRTSTKRKGR